MHCNRFREWVPGDSNPDEKVGLRGAAGMLSTPNLLSLLNDLFGV